MLFDGFDQAGKDGLHRFVPEGEFQNMILCRPKAFRPRPLRHVGPLDEYSSHPAVRFGERLNDEVNEEAFGASPATRL